MLLNAQFTKSTKQTLQPTLVFIHGLFGSLSNLGMLARAFHEQYDVVQIDLRNHGLSEHSDEMTYELMAQDVLTTLDHLDVGEFIVIGHSMGGKVAMKLADFAGARLNKLIILDMSPVIYTASHHENIFKALQAVKNANIKLRKDAIEIMQDYISETGVIQFLLKSFKDGNWLFNVESLHKNYTNIMSWNENRITDQKCLFLKGENSDYIDIENHVDAIQRQFSNSTIQVVENSGHWLHAEKTNVVVDKINNFL